MDETTITIGPALTQAVAVLGAMVLFAPAVGFVLVKLFFHPKEP